MIKFTKVKETETIRKAYKTDENGENAKLIYLFGRIGEMLDKKLIFADSMISIDESEKVLIINKNYEIAYKAENIAAAKEWIKRTEEPEPETTKEPPVEQKLNISKGNVKMGDIPSVSLPPVVTCNKNAPCFKECYARRMTRYPNVKNSWQENLNYYENDPNGFFADLLKAFKTSAYFRMHVGGDIPTADYFERLCETAKQAKKCEILIFTKQFDFVNSYIETGHKIPKNLHVIFSGWNGWKPCNPFKLPETDIFTDFATLPKKPIVCGGNCTDCICRGCGCWKLKNGQTLYFKKH